MSAYLCHFGLNEINQKLQSNGVTNLDKMSHDWYNDYDDDIIDQKRELQKVLLSILTRKEFMAFTYVIQFFDWSTDFLNQSYH